MGNVRRIVRALEICLLTGKKASVLRKEGTRPLPYEFIKIGLTREREELYRMIEARVDEMFERGLVEEVSSLLSSSGGMARTPMQAIGYKEVAAYLAGEYPLEEAQRLVKRNTRRYAKRQYTWFNKEESIRWVEVSGSETSSEVLKLVRPVVSKAGLL